MKKVLAIALALVLLVSFAACSKGEEKVTTYEGDISALIASVYEKKAPEFMIGDAMPVDMSDLWNVHYFLGLVNPEEAENATNGNVVPDTGIKEAYFSEPMISSQAYSLVVARVEDASKIEEIKTQMFEGVDTRKWGCVVADQLRVVSYADVIMLVMVSSELAPGLADGIVSAFAASVSGASVTDGDVLSNLTGAILSRG